MRITRFCLFLFAAGSLTAQLHLPGSSGAKPPKPSTQTGSASTTSAPAPSASKQSSAAAPTPGAFDYYVLSLSWAPEFCSTPANASANPQECAAGKGISFAVHGLWPEANTGKSPESCGGAKSVPNGIVKTVLPFMFSSSLVQHEWVTHGTCSGLGQAAYFTDILEARTSVQLPVQFTSLDTAVTESPAQVESQFAAANPSFPAAAFRTDCKNADLAEVRVCFDKSLAPQECTASAGECANATVRVLPVR